MYDSQLSALRAENQRIDTENKQQQKRIEKMLGTQPQTIQAANSARKELENSVLVRQLKAQINSLKTMIQEKDEEIVELKNM